MNTLLIGTSGYDYKGWKQEINGFQPFYKSKKNVLGQYCDHFQFVELNSPFYRVPSINTVKKWKNQTPDGFKFTVKVNRTMTHNKKLIDFDELFPSFFDIIQNLNDKLAGLLIQLPPSFKNTKNKSKIDNLTPLERLIKVTKFTSTNYPNIKFYVEFRDPTWFCDEVYDRLRNLWSVVFVSCGKLANMNPGFSPSLNHSNAITLPGYIYFRNHGTWLTQEYSGGYSDDQLAMMLSLFQRNTIVSFDNTDSFEGQIECEIPGKMLLSKKVITDNKLISHAIADAKKLLSYSN